MIFDLHNDILTSKMSLADKRGIIAEDIQDLKGLVLVYWTTQMKAFPDKIRLRKYKNVFYAIEDLGVLTDDDFEKLKEFNPLYCSLTWNGDNDLAGGVGGFSRLKTRGKIVIDYLNEINVVVDTAHLNRLSFYETVDRAERVMNSHTCLDSIFPHERNLKDEQIKLIIEKGGIIGLTLVSTFMSKSPVDASDYLIQIDRFVQKFGIDNVAIGSDFFGTANLPRNLRKYYDFAPFEYALINAGYKREDIDKIYFKNAQNFFNIGGNTK